MGNKKATRRVATTLAALGVLVMSSGVALMVAATPANAANKVGVCHATSSDSNPYVFISVDDDSVKLKGHLQHKTDPNKRWKSDGTFNGQPHQDLDPKPDLIGSFTDDQGVFHEMDGDITAADCEGDAEVEPAVAEVEFVDPDCDNDNTPSWEGEGEHVTFAVQSGSVAAGQQVVIRASVVEGYSFENGDLFEDFPHTFGAAEVCDIVLPPEEVTPEPPVFTDPTCETPDGALVTLPDPAPPVVIDDVKRAAVGPIVETKDVDGVHYEVSGVLAPGGTVDVDATALEGYEIAEGATTHWSHTFASLVECDPLPPIVDVPGTEVETPTATPTVVHAGLGDVVDPRGQQGLALLLAGMVIVVLAGGLGLRGAARS